MNTFKRIQNEMKDWQKHNFPGRPDWQPLMGMCEEIGELFGAHLDFRETGANAEVLDAIADIVIYMADYCNAMGYELDEIWAHKVVTEPVTIMALVRAQGEVCHAHLKVAQKIRLHEAHAENAKKGLREILWHLNRLAVTHGVVLEELVAQVWEKVRKRNWQANRNTAHIPESDGTK